MTEYCSQRQNPRLGILPHFSSGIFLKNNLKKCEEIFENSVNIATLVKQTPAYKQYQFENTERRQKISPLLYWRTEASILLAQDYAYRPVNLRRP